MARVQPPIDAINRFLYPNVITAFGIQPKRLYTRVKGKFIGIGWYGAANRMYIERDGREVITDNFEQYTVLDSQLD